MDFQRKELCFQREKAKTQGSFLDYNKKSRHTFQICEQYASEIMDLSLLTTVQKYYGEFRKRDAHCLKKRRHQKPGSDKVFRENAFHPLLETIPVRAWFWLKPISVCRVNTTAYSSCGMTEHLISSLSLLTSDLTTTQCDCSTESIHKLFQITFQVASNILTNVKPWLAMVSWSS